MTKALFPIILLFLTVFGACSSFSKEKRYGSHLVDHGTSFEKEVDWNRFWKGNLHTHSLQSDGDATVEDVVAWYKKSGYHFLSLTDHDKLVDTSTLDSKEFVTLPGDELTGRSYRVPVHVNAICGKTSLKGIRRNRTVTEILSDQITLARSDGALSIVNHPNFGWAFGAKELRKIEGFDLLEVTSGHPLVNELGGEKGASHEALWDDYLTFKGKVFGVGVDDAHHYSIFSSEKANPGKAWVEVAAPQLSREAICSALKEGNFYFSRGPRIKRLRISKTSIEIQVANWNRDGLVEFISKNGAIVGLSREMPAVYQLKGSEGYVRARITVGGTRAWTQPYFVSN